MALLVVFHFPTNQTWAVGRCQRQMEQHREERSVMARYMDSGARYLTVNLCSSPYPCVTSTSHVFSVCLCFPVCQMGIFKHLRHRVSCVRMKRVHISQVLEAFVSAYSSFPQIMASHHGLCFIPLPSQSLPKVPHQPGDSKQSGIWRWVCSNTPCFFFFQTATVSQLLRAVEHVQAVLLLGRLPGGLPVTLATPSISVYTNR